MTRLCVGVSTLAVIASCGAAAPAQRSTQPTASIPWAATLPVLAITASPTPTLVPSVVVPSPPVRAVDSGRSSPCNPASRLTMWTTQQLAWQVVAVPVQMDDLGNARTEVAAGAGALLLFGASAPSDIARQLTRLEAGAPGGIAPLVMSDIEGGAVERGTNLLGPMPSARTLAQTMTPRAITAYAASVGRRLRALGMTVDLAPVMDLDGGYGPTLADPDGTRSFSADPMVAAVDAGAFASGLAVAGVVAVGKHFPGLHGAGNNTDAGPAATHAWSTLQGRELLPYRAAIAGGIPAIMLSNASVPGLSMLPASISAQVVGALRNQLGFQGMVITDSLSSGALSSLGMSVPSASVAALVAGADLVLSNSATADVGAEARATVAAISAAVTGGRLTRAQLVAAAAHVLSAKRVALCPPA